MKRTLAVLAMCAAGKAACLLSGTARDADSGKPLGRVRVFAKPAATAKTAVLRVTGADGGFCFESLEPAVYSLVAQRSGYLVSQYGALPGHNEGTMAFTVNGRDSLPPVVIRMVAGAALSGTVVDDRGQPVENTIVDVQRKIWDLVWEPFHVMATRTGPGGTFRFPMIAPGTYFLRTEPLEVPQPGDPFYSGPMLDEKGRPLAVTSSMTFYSGSYSFGHATPIVLKAGQRIDNLLLEMKPRISRRISGRLAVALDPKALADAEAVATPVIEVGGPAGRPHSGAIRPDGSFTIEDLQPVEHEVTVDGLRITASAKADLSNGDLEGLVLEPLRTVDIRVTARVEGQDGPATGSLAICNIERECGEPVQPDARGVYGFNGLRQGLYRFRSRTTGLFVRTVAVDSRALGDAPLDLRKGAPESIAIALGANFASVEGRLEAWDSPTPGLGVSVLLVNDIRFTPEVSNNFVAVDHAGRFRFDSVMPGRYRVLAIEGFDDGPWGSPELFGLLSGKSVSVAVGDGESKTVAVPVVPVNEWAAALRKLGM